MNFKVWIFLCATFGQAMEGELSSHEQVVEAVCATGQDLNASGHFASSKIRELRKDLQEAWAALQEVTGQRSLVLHASLAMHQHYMRAGEAESWMNDRLPLVSQEEYGKDEDGTQVSMMFTMLSP